jgi:hypothetical protein
VNRLILSVKAPKGAMTMKQPLPLLAAGLLLPVLAGLLVRLPCWGATVSDPPDFPLTAGAGLGLGDGLGDGLGVGEAVATGGAGAGADET